MASGRLVDIILRLSTSEARRELEALGLTADSTSRQIQAAYSRNAAVIRGQTQLIKAQTAAAKVNASTQAESMAAMRRSFERGQAGLAAVSRGLESAGRKMTGVGIGMAAVGYVSVKSAMTFQTAMTRIQTQAGASATQVDVLSKAVLKLGGSGQVQFGPTELAKALYHIESVAAGSYPALRNTATAMAALKTAAQGAAVGGSDLEETTSALMGVLFATRAPAKDFGKIMGLINATVGAGNMTMSDLVTALGRGAIPAFKQVGLGAKDALAAIALFADSGIHASSAAAQVSTALHYLVKPSKEADKSLAAIGMTSTQMAADLHSKYGLLTALKDLRDHIMAHTAGLTSVDSGQVMASLFPGGRGRIMLTLFQNLDKYWGKLKAITDQQGKFKDSVDAQQKTLAGKLHTAWAQIQTDMTKFGIAIAPVVQKYLPIFIKAIEDIFKWLTNLSPTMKQFLVKLSLFLTIGGPLVLVLGKMVGLYRDLRGALFAIRAAGAAAATGEGAAATGANILFGALNKLKPLMWIFFALESAKSVVKTVQATKSRVHHGLRGRGGLMEGSTRDYLNGRDPLGIPTLTPHPAGATKNFINRAVNAFFGIGTGGGLLHGFKLFGAQGGLVTHQGIRHMAAGGPIGTDNIPAFLSAGEGVVNRAGMSGLGASGLAALNSGVGATSHIVIEPAPITLLLDGRVVARAVLQQTLRKAARGPSTLSGGQIAIGAAPLGH